jgi:hypothetical protein
VKQIPTDCISVSGDMCKHVLEKIVGGGQGKQKYPARKCRGQKKRMRNLPMCKFIVFGASSQGLVFLETSHTHNHY